MFPLKKILLFGAGKSTTSLINYLLLNAKTDNLELTVADANITLAEEKISGNLHGKAVQIDILNNQERSALVKDADLVISMMPPALHNLVANTCLTEGKSLLTASYADDAMKSLNVEVVKKGLLFLCEMGLDPGIDHMSAMHIIESIREKGGVIKKFFSHCGGLVAPESDDNPWHYKITWNPRNVVVAGKGGAQFLSNGEAASISYQNLFNPLKQVATGNEQTPFLSYYPNRNSIPYISLYGLQSCTHFMRTTLRYPEFMKGWQQMIELGFTDDTIHYQTNGMSLANFFEIHLKSRNIEVGSPNKFSDQDFLKQLQFLGLNDNNTFINLGEVSIIDIMVFVLQTKLVLHPHDKDLVVMIHEFTYQLDGKEYLLHSSLYLKGENHLETAMSKTVGLPLGIAARKILKGEIKATGVLIPLERAIYLPLLKELELLGIRFLETEVPISV